MELTLKKVQQLDEQSILNIILPTINDYYKKNDYTEITYEEYINLVLKEIDKSKRSYTGNVSYIDYIKREINMSMLSRIKYNFSIPKTASIIINNYINKYFKNNEKYEDIIKNFKKLDNMFKKYQYISTPDTLIAVIEDNALFSKMIECVINSQKNQIISGNLEKIFDNGTIISIIETYCMLNNIEIDNSLEFEKNSIDLDNIKVSDSVKVYLQEISQRKLLSKEEEQELALRIIQGDNYAKEILIESNLKLVVSIAKRYIDRGMPFLDLIQEGNIGLMNAVDKYDINREVKFSTYATWWIRQAITRAIADKGRNVRIPVYMYEKVGNYKKVITALESELNREPTINEIASKMGMTISKVTKLHKLQNDTISMNALAGKEDTELEKFIPSADESLEDIAIANTMQLEVKKLLEKCNLEQREIEVLMLRFGFDNREPMSLEEVGKIFNLSRERVRQIEATTFMKLRRSKHIKEFADYMNNPDQSLRNIQKFRELYLEAGNSTKSLLRGKEIIGKSREQEMPKLQTIYQYFNDYTKEQVDAMLEKLTDEERELITFRYGKNLENPITGKLSKEQTNKFYRSLVPKMRRLLENPNSERNRKTAKKVDSSKETETLVKEDYSKQNQPSIEKLPLPVVPTVAANIEPNTINYDIAKSDYVKMLELLRTPTFAQMINVLSVKESIILSLRLGYVDGKHFSAESIAEFLEIEKEEVIETTKKVILLYKENINDFIDNGIRIVTEQPKKLLKK